LLSFVAETLRDQRQEPRHPRSLCLQAALHDARDEMVSAPPPPSFIRPLAGSLGPSRPKYRRRRVAMPRDRIWIRTMPTQRASLSPMCVCACRRCVPRRASTKHSLSTPTAGRPRSPSPCSRSESDASAEGLASAARCRPPRDRVCDSHLTGPVLRPPSLQPPTPPVPTCPPSPLPSLPPCPVLPFPAFRPPSRPPTLPCSLPLSPPARTHGRCERTRTTRWARARSSSSRPS